MNKDGFGDSFKELPAWVFGSDAERCSREFLIAEFRIRTIAPPKLMAVLTTKTVDLEGIYN